MNNVCGWTNWTPLVGFDGHENQTDVFYRTNHKKTQVMFLTDKVRGESCCTKGDDFNLAIGVRIAYYRCLNKALTKRKAEYESELKMINCEIADNRNVLKKMINNLGD